MSSSMPRRAALTAAVTALALAAGARADERPLTMPTRDVDITYQMPAPGPNGQVQELSERQRWNAEGGQMRLDTPNPGVYTVMDYHDHKLLVVREADHSVLIMHTGESSAAPGVSRTAQFTRVDQDNVAGLPCTDWRTQDLQGRPSTVCLTGDGVLLRAKSGDTVLVQATHVVYGPVDPSVFTPPADYHPVTPPQ